MTDIHYQLQRFLDHSLAVKGNRKKTVHDIKTSFEGLDDFGDIRRFSDFNTEVIEDWVARRKIQRGWSAKTIRTRLTYLSLFADWLVRRGYLEKNPVKDVPRPKLPRRLPRAISAQSCDEILDWVKGFPFKFKFERMRAIAIISTFMATGMRHSELRNLKICDVDIENNEIFIRHGKGDKDRKVYFRGSLRIVLERYLRERTRLKKSCPEFFTAMRQNSGMGPKVIYRLCDRLKEKSGIQFTPHVLRHSFATRMLGRVHIRKVQELMGHSHMSTTEIYLSVCDDELKGDVLARGIDV